MSHTRQLVDLSAIAFCPARETNLITCADVFIALGGTQARHPCSIALEDDIRGD